MIVVNLIGGLGNQMFQYAFGLILSKHIHESEVCYDSDELLNRSVKENFTFRDFELSVFRCNPKIASKSQLAWFFPNSSSLPDRIISKLKRAIRPPVIFNEQTQYKYDSNVLKLKGNIYASGYWQVASYYETCVEQIREAFTFKNSPSEDNARIIKKINAVNSVSLHVRRGDYVSNAQSNQVHGTCSPEYYKSAVEHIASRIGAITLFVFSDDQEWAKENLVFQHPVVYVEGNVGNASYEDMRLMSLCKHNIIANSSFSWWGAWLNSNETKIVVAPKRWLTKLPEYPLEILPDSWVTF